MSVDIWRAKEAPVKQSDPAPELMHGPQPDINKQNSKSINDKKRIQMLRRMVIRHNAMREGIPLKCHKEILELNEELKALMWRLHSTPGGPEGDGAKDFFFTLKKLRELRKKLLKRLLKQEKDWKEAKERKHRTMLMNRRNQLALFQFRNRFTRMVDEANLQINPHTKQLIIDDLERIGKARFMAQANGNELHDTELLTKVLDGVLSLGKVHACQSALSTSAQKEEEERR